MSECNKDPVIIYIDKNTMPFLQSKHEKNISIFSFLWLFSFTGFRFRVLIDVT